MPTSYKDFKNQIKEYIYKKYSTDIKILDIGPGLGTYAQLLPDYKNIDCVEIYSPYIEEFNLKSQYKNVFNLNILDFDFEYYDLIIMGDILEHLSPQDSLKLLKKLTTKCDDIIISIPYLADYNHLKIAANEPNINNLHIQIDLTPDIMKERYPMLKQMWSNSRIGVYIKEKYKYNSDKDLAITVYVDDNINMIEEFNWLYKSFIYSGNYKNSDIIAFCNPLVITKLDINILNDKNVVIIPSEPISNIDSIWSDYKFVNSVYFLTTKEAEILLNYKYTLSTDADEFMTKNLINLRPHIHTFGLGHYIFEWDNYSRSRIENILKKFNLKYNFIHNVGQSLLYKSKHVLDFRKLQYDICKHLMLNEFPEYGKWGSWYKGVITMYAGEIAANQLGHANIITNVLDSYCMSDSNISNNFYLIHAWHTSQYFSKHKFREGEYKNIDIDMLNLEIVNNYCLYLATKSIEDIKKICNY